MKNTMTLTKTEQKVLDLFDTRRNEDGRVQVFSVTESKAAWKLASKGLVRCEYVEVPSYQTKAFNFGTMTLRVSSVSRAVSIWKI